jgi:SPP1 family predicted phage head-tail adaptor
MPSTLIGAAELAGIRSAVANLLPHSCVISSLGEVADGQGGFTQGWTASGTVDCRIAAKSGNVRAVGGQNAPLGAYTLTVPHDTTINVDDRATIDGVVYRVTFVDDVKDWKAAIRCDVDIEVS